MHSLVAAVQAVDPLVVTGKVAGVSGLLIESRGGLSRLSVGARAEIDRHGRPPLPAEVVGFREAKALLMPFGPVEGVAPGADIRIVESAGVVRPTAAWLGRIINAFGEPIDGKGPLPPGPRPYPLRAAPPPAHTRGRVGERLDTGVRALDVFATTCRGQRMGIFAGSGVGKSVLLSMLARRAECDAVVVGLIGERGREVREFIEETLGPEGLARAIVVVATSDEPALTRRQAAYMTLACAEYLRDQGKQVLCLMDSVTRFAMAQREIGLAAGEPPTTKGYTPTVFSELPKLLERAGPGPVRSDGRATGAITALFTVLVDGGTRVLQGPGTFRVAENATRTTARFSNLTRRRAARSVRTGAVRGAGTDPNAPPPPTRSPNLWFVNVAAAGPVCLYDLDRVRLWRPETDGAQTYKIQDKATQASLDVEFVGTEAVRALDPAGMTLTGGTSYTITAPAGEDGQASTVDITLITLTEEYDDPAALASALHQNGCTEQLGLLADTLEDAAAAE